MRISKIFLGVLYALSFQHCSVLYASSSHALAVVDNRAISVRDFISAAVIGNLQMIEHHPEMHGARDEDRCTALMKAAYYGHAHVVAHLITHEAGMVDKNKASALMKAAERGNTEIVMALAPYEAGLVALSHKSALMIAIDRATSPDPSSKKSFIEIIKILAPYEKHLQNECGEDAEEYLIDKCARLGIRGLSAQSIESLIAFIRNAAPLNPHSVA